MNSTPADSKARRIASSLAVVSAVTPSATSARLIVLTPRDALWARSTALHFSRARAARIWALDRAVCFIDFDAHMGYLNPCGHMNESKPHYKSEGAK